MAEDSGGERLAGAGTGGRITEVAVAALLSTACLCIGRRGDMLIFRSNQVVKSVPCVLREVVGG